MTDNAPSVIDVRDDGLVGVFTVTGSVGVSPNRPVCITGNLQVQQILVKANAFLGVVTASGSDGEAVSVRRKGQVKVYGSGAITAGEPVIATGTSTAASFVAATAYVAVSGAVYTSVTRGVFKVAGTALQNCAGYGDTLLIDLGA